ncbi:hypothetical protein F5X96DRAFT_621434 [Biscogniauxia mediterranea]|nr:hypothetical protein F5X96DRAFT_621434 [Biscogniauxia mediterranea]
MSTPYILQLGEKEKKKSSLYIYTPVSHVVLVPTTLCYMLSIYLLFVYIPAVRYICLTLVWSMCVFCVLDLILYR